MKYRKSYGNTTSIGKKGVDVGISTVKCPRCGGNCMEREHGNITEKLLQQAVYYTKWFVCMNSSCKKDIFYLEKYKVYNRKHGNKPGYSKQEDEFVRNYVKRYVLTESKDATTKGGGQNWNLGSQPPTPPWFTDKEYEVDLRLQAIKEQLKPRS